MALVPEEDLFKTEERKVNTSPLVKSLANMDLEIKAILEDTSMPPDRKIQLYDSIMSRYRNILNQYRSKIPYVRVLPKPKRKKRKRPKRPAFATPIGSAVLPTPPPPPVEVPEEEEEDEEPLLIPTPPTDASSLLGELLSYKVSALGGSIIFFFAPDVQREREREQKT